MSDQVRTYIEENLHRTIKPGKNGLKPFTVPSWDAYFSDFYYWDTYFTDLALLACGEFTQVRNNLDKTEASLPSLHARSSITISPGIGIRRSPSNTSPPS